MAGDRIQTLFRRQPVLGDSETIFWAILAALAFVGEILSVSFFLLFFALGAAVALVAALLGAGIVAQALGFVAASLLSLVVLRPVLLHRISLGGGERYVSRAGITGKSGIVTNAIEPGASGMVRIGDGEFWTARAVYPSQKIEAGSRVRVLDTDGLTALVESMEIEKGG
ncbi:MAG: NfeD family protein [Actinobacteria bacterium]|nr:NfeD family protein [Actinomycetota bacterium]